MNLSGGEWINPNGYELDDTGYTTPGFPPWRRRKVYEYTADPIFPLTFHIAAEDLFIRPDRHGWTDGLTVPGSAQIIVPSSLCCKSAIVHDAACRERCLYFAHVYDGPYVKLSVSSAEAARWLGMGLYASGFVKRSQIVYRFVLWCGPQFKSVGACERLFF